MDLVTAKVRSWRGRLTLTYGLVVVENTFELLAPFAIGLAVDDLLADEWTGVVVFAALSLLHTAVAFTRQRFDARSFTKLYELVATEVVESQRAAGVDTSAIAGRTSLAAEYVDFYERDIPMAITAAFAVIGSLIMLTIYDLALGAAAAAVALPVLVLNRRLIRRSRRIFRRINDRAEVEVAVIDAASEGEVRRHFALLSRQWVRLSDAEATSWGLVEVVATGLLVFALIRTTDSGADVGTIFATLAYVWAYVGGFDQVPAVLQRLASLGDIRRRLADDHSPPAA